MASFCCCYSDSYKFYTLPHRKNAMKCWTGLHPPTNGILSCCVDDGDFMMFMEQGAGVFVGYNLNLCHPWTHIFDYIFTLHDFLMITWYNMYLGKLQSVTNLMHRKHVQEVLILWGFIVMFLCGGLCTTENSSTPRQGNAEDRADYSSFSALLSRLNCNDFNVELISI